MLNDQNGDQKQNGHWNHVRLQIGREGVEEMKDEWLPENLHLESTSEKMEQEK